MVRGGHSAIPSKQVCSWEALHTCRAYWVFPAWCDHHGEASDVDMVMVEMVFLLYVLVSWQGGKCLLHVSKHGSREGQEMWRCPLQGRKARWSSATTDQGGPCAFPPGALPKAAAARGMGLSTFTASFARCSWSSCAVRLLVWVAAAIPLGLCEQCHTSWATLSEGEREGKVFTWLPPVEEHVPAMCLWGWAGESYRLCRRGQIQVLISARA